MKDEGWISTAVPQRMKYYNAEVIELRDVEVDFVLVRKNDHFEFGNPFLRKGIDELKL